MCGLVGVYSYKNQINQYKQFVLWALKTMKKRGPDSSAVWSNNTNYIAGFNRLSIRDLSSEANQPMVSNCGNYVLLFNGEIYNSNFFKKKLKSLGIKFNTTSDTEVLLYGLIHFGLQEVLSSFDGIYAFSYYNVNKNSLILARDRAGVKPLYYGYSDEGIVYSSQYDHIINHPYIKHNSLDACAIGSYLQFGYMIEGDNGIFENTSFLPHGHYLSIINSHIELKQYWEYPSKVQPRTSCSLEEIINESTNQQLVSDVPIGTFMSGGNDSTLITNFANLNNQKIKSFNIGMLDKEFDESEASMAYATYFQTDHKRKFITENDILDLIDSNVESFSEPFADYSSIPTLFLSEFAKQDITVALSGDGGDELFWGYPRNNSIAKKINWITSSKATIAKRLILEKLFNLERNVSKKELFYRDFNDYYYHSLFISGAAHWVPKIVKTAPSLSKFYLKGTNDTEHYNIMRKLEYDLHLQRILLKVDRASMYHSLEVRIPLLSNKVIDKSTEYTFKECVQNDLGKIPLKNILSKYVDNGLINRKKQGFTIPIDTWLRSILKKDVEEKLMNMDSELSQYLNEKQIHKLLCQHNSGKYSWGWMIWSIYSLIRWHETHVKKLA